MNRKGFTLIELLAVIVILAIIALIVTPIVSNIIESARSSANARSVEGHIKNVELAIIRNAFSNEKTDLEVYDVNNDVLPNNLVIPDNDKIICLTYTIVDGQVLEAIGCSNSGWAKVYRYSKSNGVEISGDSTSSSIVNATEIEFSSTEDDWKTNANIKTVQEALDYLHNNM